MKANNGSGNNSLRDEWRTSEILFNVLNNQYKFIFDCCATYDNRKTIQYTSCFEGIEHDMGMSWMNPPFSKSWKMFEHFFKVVNQGVAIYRCDNFETKIWQELIFPNCSWVFIPKRRVNYDSFDYKRPEGAGSRFPSALIGFNVDPPENLDGICLKPLCYKLVQSKEKKEDD